MSAPAERWVLGKSPIKAIRGRNFSQKKFQKNRPDLSFPKPSLRFLQTRFTNQNGWLSKHVPASVSSKRPQFREVSFFAGACPTILAGCSPSSRSITTGAGRLGCSPMPTSASCFLSW